MLTLHPITAVSICAAIQLCNATAGQTMDLEDITTFLVAPLLESNLSGVAATALSLANNVIATSLVGHVAWCVWAVGIRTTPLAPANSWILLCTGSTALSSENISSSAQDPLRSSAPSACSSSRASATALSGCAICNATRLLGPHAYPDLQIVMLAYQCKLNELVKGHASYDLESALKTVHFVGQLEYFVEGALIPFVVSGGSESFFPPLVSRAADRCTALGNLPDTDRHHSLQEQGPLRHSIHIPDSRVAGPCCHWISSFS